MEKICIVEDDEKLRNELKIFLSKNGYKVELIQTFENVVEDVLQKEPDLLLLDINLPVLDGHYICRTLREKSELPIIIITSKNTEMDELLSINFGADDFITKPFNTQILLARIASILKRINHSKQEVVILKEFKFDISKGIIEKEDKKVELTKNELKILNFLIQNKDMIVSRDRIMTYLWDSEMFVDDNTLTVNIKRLRKKLEKIGVYNKIETKRGLGYLLHTESCEK